MAEVKKKFFNKNVTIHIKTKDGLQKASFKQGDACPTEIVDEMLKAKHLASEKPEEIIEGAAIDQSKKVKLPELAERN